MTDNAMTKNRAEAVLGLSGAYTRDHVRLMFRTRARECHPDIVAVRGGDKAEAEREMSEINEANAYLVSLFDALSCDVLVADCDFAEKVDASESACHSDCQDSHGNVYTYENWTTKLEEIRARAAEDKAKKAAEEAQKAAVEEEKEQRKRSYPSWYRVLTWPIRTDIPWRLVILLIAMEISFQYGYYSAPHSPSLGSFDTPEFMLLALLFSLAALINLFTGFINKTISKGIISILDAITGFKTRWE